MVNGRTPALKNQFMNRVEFMAKFGNFDVVKFITLSCEQFYLNLTIKLVIL
jgi:hypothetical protein